MLIVAAVALAYAPSFDGAFLLDDYQKIVRNPALDGLGSALLRTSRPVLFFTLWLNRALGGGQAWGFHLVNLLIHAGAALALYGVVRRALRLAPPAPGWAERADGVALACAVLWGVHPLTTGAVTYI